MVDIIKQDMTDIWAVAGDIVAPDSAKVRAGWAVEAVPRQWWNWFENRQDTNIAYMLQKGIPEWDQFTEYLTNKSYVQRNNIVYKCILTSTNQDPATAPTYWVKAFPESSIGLETLKSVIPANNTIPYFTGTNTASTTTLSPFMRTVLDDTDAATVRATISAQEADATLTALAGLPTATNKLPYFTGTDLAALTDFTSFARTLLDDTDATAARATLSVYSIAQSDSNLTAGLAGKQPLATNLTNLANLTIVNNTMPYYNGTGVLTLSPVTTYGRGFLNLADATASRTYIGADDASNLTTGTLPLARIPTDLTGVNAATATKLQTARTIQGVAFDGTANITLSVVDKDSSVGSAALPSGTSAQRTASPQNGMLRYNSDTNEFEGYQNGAWAGIGGGTPLYTVLWWPNRASIPAGYVPADGQLLTRTSYQAAFAGVNSGILPVVSDTTWLATSTSRGCYTPGNGTTTFRIPDLNGTQAGTIAAPFLRGDGTNSTGVAGNLQADAFQNHQVSFLSANIAGSTGSPFETIVAGAAGSLASATGATGFRLGLSSFTSAAGFGTPRVAVETRPTNVTGVFVIKLIGGASELSQDDASVAVAALEDKLQYVSGRNLIINGGMSVAQRATATFANNVTGYAGPDRYFAANNAAGGSFTQALSTFLYEGVNRYSVLQTVTSPLTTSTGGANWAGISQRIEGANCYHVVGKPLAISFVFKSNVSGNFSVAVRTGVGGDYSFVTTFTAVANIPQKVSISIPSVPLAATIPADTTQGMSVNIGAYGTGTTVTPSPNAWATGNYTSGTGLVNWAATNANYIAVTDLQLEVGTQSTEFERLSQGVQLAACQRYYASYSNAIRYVSYAGGASTGFVDDRIISTPMRATPTATVTGVTFTNLTTASVTGVSNATFRVNYVNTAIGNVTYAATGLTLDAEL